MPLPAGEIVGIDLGTTNSLVAVCDSRGPRVLPDEQGRPLVPSVVRYDLSSESAGRQPVVGFEAKVRAAEHPRSTIASVKRLMGRSLADVRADLPHLSYDVVAGEHNTARIAIAGPPGGNLVLTPEEVSAAILRRLKEQASRALGREVVRAVVTVPAYFDHAQREATRTAGRLAGIDVVRIVPEPTAAALAYGLGVGGGLRGNEGGRPRHVAVYDLGGGTFDISILRLTPSEGEGGTDFFQVLATAGDTHLGGDDVDYLLSARFIGEVESGAGNRDADAALSAGDRQAIRSAAERAKCELSEGECARVSVRLTGGARFERDLTRSELESIAGTWVERTIEACGRALRDARREMGAAPLDAVILVGGATRMPIVRRRVREFFGLEPYTALDPDQVVALGAAVQAGILSGAVKGALLLDVIPLSLGVETVGGAVAKVIFRNSTVPARATEMFSTSVDGQTSIKLHVLQGEREMAADCRSLGVFHLRGLPPMPAGIPQLEVEFLVDANGVLKVAAHERRSGKRAELQVVPNHGLTAEEVARMEAEALGHAREDMTRHRVVDLIVNSKLDLKWIGERLERFGGLLEEGYREDLKSQISNLKAQIEKAEGDWRSVDANAFQGAKERLDRASVRLQEVAITESLRQDAGRGPQQS